ncbi:MAG: hypothetical protein L6Q78_09930 [Bacteroidia bacterium]|nr:hypothetical protein [Bacteroidia bacterium]
MDMLIRCIKRLFFLSLIGIACQAPKQKGDAEKGLTYDDMPPTIQALYNNSRGGDSAYSAEAGALYLKYLKEGQRDSALFCLIAFNEVLDQNYIYDSLVMFWSKEHLAKGLGTKENQHELLKLGYYIGSMYYTIENSDSTFYWLNYTLNHPSALPRTKVRCRTMLANTYANLNKMDSSIALKQANLDYYLRLKDTVNICVSSNNLANDFRYIFAYNLALEYIENGLRLATIKKDTFLEIMLRHNLGLVYAEDEDSVGDMTANVHRINFLMDHYSRKNLNMEYSQAISNIQFYGIRRELDSMEIWMNRFKAICEIQQGSSITKYQTYSAMLANFRNKPLTNTGFLKENAFNSREMKEYKEAISCYNVLFKSAKNSGQLNLALAYQDTLDDLHELLYRENFNGKIYEMEVKYKTKLREQELLLKDEELLSRNRTLILLAALLVILVLLFVKY